MSNLSELDLQNLRHLITGYETCGEKMSCYAKEATDPEVKNFLKMALIQQHKIKKN